jgi:hypothetical protein
VVALTLPTTTSPGQYPQESGGRITNAYVEPLVGNAGTKFALKRVAGLSAFATTSQTGFRGAQLVGSTLYSAFSGKAVKSTSAGGAATVLTGSLNGTLPVIWARNNASTPDLVAVAPGDGAFVVSSTAVSAYPDADVGSPNSVCFLKGFFIFSQENGKVIASDINSTNINTLNYANAESKPDILYRAVTLGNGQLLLCGDKSIEVWGGQNDTGFPFSYIQTIDRGILGRYCITGYEDGWGRERYLIGDDGGVYKLVGYQLTPIGTPDLSRLILSVSNTDTLQMSVYVANGLPFVVVQCPAWTWEYDVSQSVWHERKSAIGNGGSSPAWRGLLPHQAFGKWICGDRQSGDILAIDAVNEFEGSQPLVFEVETGPQGNFPNGARVNRLDLYCSVGVGVASGIDPIETDPVILIFISRDNGLKWSSPWTRKLGRQAIGLQKITVNEMGHCGPQGVKFKFRISDPVHIGLMGGDIDVTLLGK